ncbi:BRCT [Penicillium camemberti]|uniref:BRCT n=1 Tax=Penicillium camemberti (strain FM 013) TaxID=1429867 RepID=A0A0G4PBD7_PENC3|nr:BRCT [Penicillium camemberti]
MATENGESKLFEQCCLCIVCSKDLPSDSAEQLATLLEQNGGEALIVQPGAEVPDVAKFSHLISTTIDFEAYDTTCDALIPVVKPQWVNNSLTKRKLANPRQYSPDPRLFMNDVVVTCGDIPEGDKDAIIGGVVAKGGLYAPRVSQMVTHLVDLTAESDKARIVQAKKLNVKIVLPHWFDDCLKLGRRIDERPYTLPDPEILRVGPDTPIRWQENKDLVGASTTDPSKLPEPSSSAHKSGQRSVFEGKSIMLSPDLGIGSHLQESIKTVLEQGGATMTSNVDGADMLICRYREGFAYRTASRLNIDVGNLAWLYRLMTFNTYTSPLRRLLHYPISRTGIPGFEGLKISLSNYVGEARIYLENLIAAAGAECTKTLKQENTHLITAHGTSEKCNAAKEWGLEVVNHLWLEDSYAKWKLQPASNPRYSHFPLRTNLGEVAGQTQLDRNVLEQVFFSSGETVAHSPRRAMQSKNQNMVSVQPPAEKKRKIDEDAPETSLGTPQGNGKSCRPIQTPARTRIMSEGKENETPSSTSSRKSKEAATARLHEYAPDLALYEKERKRVGGVIYGGRRKSDEGRVQENKKRASLEAEDESDGEQAVETKRQKKSRPPIAMHLLITGYQRWVGKGNEKREDADKRGLRDLGIMVVQDARRCTHLAAPSILRTTKFVNALAYAPMIVSTDFITSCLKKEELLDPSDFPLEDKEAEKKYNFDLSSVTTNAKKNKNKMLQGYRIYCVEDIRGGFDAFKSIVETNGGECMLFRGRLAIANHSRREESDEDSEAEDDNPASKDVFLLSSAGANHGRVWPRFRQVALDIKKTPRIVRVDWLLDMAMSQETRAPDEYELTEEMIENADQ